VIQLICIDVDGTLVGTSGGVLPAVWPAAERARANGARLAICSGRPAFGDALGYAQRLDPTGWHIFQNGASVIHLETLASRSMGIAPHLVSEIVRQSRNGGPVVELYTDLEYAVEVDDTRARQHAKLLGVPLALRSLDALSAPVVRALWLCPPNRVDAVVAAAPPGLELGTATSPPMPSTVFINVTPAGVNKAVAVRTIATEYRIPLGNVMYVGDGHVDIGPMREVGVPVAMGNGEPDVKAASQHIVASVDDGGLVEALELALRL
jgi:Cof subfamily protein (haloacid dehalogenase superfamily)